jgi:hypothetical protein
MPLTSADKKHFERFRLFFRSRLESHFSAYNPSQVTNIFFREARYSSVYV